MALDSDWIYRFLGSEDSASSASSGGGVLALGIGLGFGLGFFAIAKLYHTTTP
jgi:hypothetical protein